jgi:TPR repeat protein
MDVADDLYGNGHFFDAFHAYKALAEDGSAKAQEKVGMMYRDAQGVEQDFREALQWFEKAAAQDDTQAMISVGFLYGNGQGVPRNYSEEMKWIRRAAEANDPAGQYDLGVMIMEGRQTPGFERESASWIDKAAQQGYPPAFMKMGLLYARGGGVPRDKHAAYYCLYLSSLLGQKPGRDLVDVRRGLSKDQIFEIQKEAKEWMSQYGPPEAKESAEDVQTSTASANISVSAPISAKSTPPAPVTSLDPTARPAGY